MYRKFPHLSAPLQVGNIILRNRMFSAPMSHPNITPEGLITPQMTAYYELRARGGAAVVTVSEPLATAPERQLELEVAPTTVAHRDRGSAERHRRPMLRAQLGLAEAQARTAPDARRNASAPR